MSTNALPPILGAETGYPRIVSEPTQTGAGTPYLCEPGVSLVGRSAYDQDGLGAFLDGFDSSLRFGAYVEDPDVLPPGASLCKAAGQLCYMSFGPKRTHNADAVRYFDNLKRSGHGSIFEHAAFSFLFYGISRSLTHELVRHRAGFAFSQVSQRYVSGRVLRFVERPEFQADPDLHSLFEARIDRAAHEYEEMASVLLDRQHAGAEILSAEARTDLRKKVQQAARAVLPNETEAPIFVTANGRAWRHFVEMRASEHAETEIRELAFRVFRCLVEAEPQLFGDYEVVALSDGTHGVTTSFSKV